jgi:hypothetical protein
MPKKLITENLRETGAFEEEDTELSDIPSI